MVIVPLKFESGGAFGDGWRDKLASDHSKDWSRDRCVDVS